MNRKIIQIDEEKCIGCGLCINTCHQSTLALVNGKAKVVNENYCDGLGNCLPGCPVGAISFSQKDITYQAPSNNQSENISCDSTTSLKQWPVKMRLVNPTASFLKESNLLIAADCSAMAYNGFHNNLLKDHIVLILCPKFDQVDYIDKLSQIIANNQIKSITIAQLEVPCCSGIEKMVKTAVKNSNTIIPVKLNIITRDGQIIQ